jgi:hypothetical protein
MESKSDNDKISEESLTFDKITEILNPTGKNICEINLGDEKSCPGYFCVIPFPDKDNLLTVITQMITECYTSLMESPEKGKEGNATWEVVSLSPQVETLE